MSIVRSILEAKPRQGAGKGAARKLRAQGLVPAVVYGKHLEKPVQVAVDPAAVRAAINTPQKMNTLITVKADGVEHQVMLKEYQHDPITRALLHVDFVEVRENEPVRVNIPLVLIGKAEGVLVGGILQQTRRELEVFSLPGAIPEKIEADVTHLKIAQALHINDVKLPEGVKVRTHVNFTVAVVAVPEKEEVAPVAAAVPGAPVEGAPVEGAPAEGAAAAAPAAGAPAAPGAPAAGGEKAPAPAKGGKREREDRKK